MLRRGVGRRNLSRGIGLPFFGAPGSVLDMDFRQNRYFGRTLADMECARVSGAYTETAAGDYVYHTDHVPRRTDNGLMSESIRTNVITNSWTIGAAVGNPGLLPAGWAAIVPTGTTLSVEGKGTTKGLPYVDLRLRGTATGGSFRLQFDPAGEAVAPGQNWAGSFFLQALEVKGLTDLRAAIRKQNSSGIFIGDTVNSNILSAAATWGRFATSNPTTLGDAKFFFGLLGPQNFTGGVVLDEMLRVGLPQFEQWDPTIVPSSPVMTSSPIRTEEGAAARGGEVLRVPLAGLGLDTALTCVVIARTSRMNRNYGTYVEFNNWFTPGSMDAIALRNNSNATTMILDVVTDDNANQDVPGYTIPPRNTRFCAAFAFTGHDLAWSLNGQPIKAVTSTVPFEDGGYQWLNFGGTWGGVHQSENFVERVIVYSGRRSNAELVALSNPATWDLDLTSWGD
ncbi:hypothetical protein [Microvirga sp. M2]|uniref:hypothetical protein n=1 Tax=Microvirga sp. M2 TaxID=3073270 RepID=UPI0039C07700